MGVMEAGERYRVKGKWLSNRRMVVELMEPAITTAGPAWWCLPIFGGNPTYDYGWRAFYETDLEPTSKRRRTK